jgi:hypothetical protein
VKNEQPAYRFAALETSKPLTNASNQILHETAHKAGIALARGRHGDSHA